MTSNELVLIKPEAAASRTSGALGGCKIEVTGNPDFEAAEGEDNLGDYTDGYAFTSKLSIGNDAAQLLYRKENWGYCLTKKDITEDDKEGAACHIITADDTASDGSSSLRSKTLPAGG